VGGCRRGRAALSWPSCWFFVGGGVGLCREEGGCWGELDNIIGGFQSATYVPLLGVEARPALGHVGRHRRRVGRDRLCSRRRHERQKDQSRQCGQQRQAPHGSSRLALPRVGSQAVGARVCRVCGVAGGASPLSHRGCPLRPNVKSLSSPIRDWRHRLYCVAELGARWTRFLWSRETMSICTLSTMKSLTTAKMAQRDFLRRMEEALMGSRGGGGGIARLWRSAHAARRTGERRRNGDTHPSSLRSLYNDH
jgi:hypothetical protein